MQTLSCEIEFYLYEPWKFIFISMASYLALLWNRAWGNLEIAHCLGIQCSSEISKTHSPFLDIRVGMHAWTLMHVFLSYSLPLFFFVFHCLAKRIYSFLNEHLFLYQNIHVPWSFRRIKIYSPTAKTNNK